MPGDERCWRSGPRKWDRGLRWRLLQDSEEEQTDGKKTWQRPDAQLKTNVAVEASSTEATIAELSTKYQLHPNQIYAWEKLLLDGALRQDRPADSRARLFIPEVRTMSRAERVAMIDLGRAGLCAKLRRANNRKT